MTDAHDLELDAIDESQGEMDNPRLDAWLKRTTSPLDLLALLTIWITLVPIGDFHKLVGHPAIWIVARVSISIVYLVDVIVRVRLAHRKWHYLITHPVAVIAVVLPAVRLIFSLRLLTAMFRKGNLLHFLGVSLILLANLTIIVYGFEHKAPHANITTIGDAVWWSCVTVFTVGYGDFYPVTTQGRIFAVMIMCLGLLTAAVITAQIASSFMDQAAARRAALSSGTPEPEISSDAATIEVLHAMQKGIAEKLDRIESHVRPSDHT